MSKPWLDDGDVQLHHGDVIDVLRSLPAVKTRGDAHSTDRYDKYDAGSNYPHSLGGYGRYDVTTTGWRASCTCDAPTRPQLVLDPFIGSGTTALVARNHARRCIGIDLSAEYLAIAARRLQQLSLLGGTT